MIAIIYAVLRGRCLNCSLVCIAVSYWVNLWQSLSAVAGGYFCVPLKNYVFFKLCDVLLLLEGIPTTRAAALVISSDLVKRDVLYNGNILSEKTAIVLRLAPSWFRIGSFELLARDGEIDLLKQLSNFVMKTYFPELSSAVNNRLS